VKYAAHFTGQAFHPAKPKAYLTQRPQRFKPTRNMFFSDHKILPTQPNQSNQQNLLASSTQQLTSIFTFFSYGILWVRKIFDLPQG